MRALALLLVASTAHADPLVGVSARRAWVPAGGDHGEWEGLGVTIEPSSRARTSLRLYAGIDELTNHSDEDTFAYAGYQVTALAGVRIVLTGGPNARLFYACAAGGGYVRTAHPGADTVASERLYAEPARLGIEYDVGPSVALRTEAAVDVYWTSYDPIAVILAGGVAIRL